MPTILRLITLEFPLGPVEVVEFWRVYYEPTNGAFKALAADPTGQADLRASLERFWSGHNKATDATTQVESEYLEVHATRS